MDYNKTNGTYDNIENVSTENLLKMLQMPNYQSDDYQKMIKDELKFRNEGLSFNRMIDVFNNGEKKIWVISLIIQREKSHKRN